MANFKHLEQLWLLSSYNEKDSKTEFQFVLVCNKCFDYNKKYYDLTDA